MAGQLLLLPQTVIMPKSKKLLIQDFMYREKNVGLHFTSRANKPQPNGGLGLNLTGENFVCCCMGSG
jgi:hypothetical protein